MLLKGEKMWFDEIYLKYHKEIYRYVYSLSYDKNIVDDIVQETFTILYKKQNEVKHYEDIRGWLYTVARNKTGDYLKKYNRERKYKLSISFENLQNIYDIDTVPELDIYDALQTFLSDEELELLKLKESGFTFEEIASDKKIKSTTLRSKVSRIYAKIRKKYSERRKFYDED